MLTLKFRKRTYTEAVAGMLNKLEEARRVSKKVGMIWAMSNGTSITYTADAEAVDDLGEVGYWLYCVFERGEVVLA